MRALVRVLVRRVLLKIRWTIEKNMFYIKLFVVVYELPKFCLNSLISFYSGNKNQKFLALTKSITFSHTKPIINHFILYSPKKTQQNNLYNRPGQVYCLLYIYPCHGREQSQRIRNQLSA